MVVKSTHLEEVAEFVALIDFIGENLQETAFGKIVKDNILLLSCYEYSINVISGVEENLYSIFYDDSKRKFVLGANTDCKICFDIQLNILKNILEEKESIKRSNIKILKYFFQYLGSVRLLEDSQLITELKGSNVTLRKVKETELQEILLWYMDKELNHLAGYAYNEPNIYKLRSNMQSSFGKDPMNLVIELNSSELPIGTIQLYDINKFDRNCMFGIRIGKTEYQGKGIGVEAINLIVQYAFNVLKLKRVSLKVYEYNKNAIKCYLKTGFEIEGKLRKSVKIDGIYYDEILMSIINPEEYNL